MDSIITGLKGGDALFLVLTALVVITTSLVSFAICFYWFKREQKRMHKRNLKAIADAIRDPDELFLTGRDTMAYGELVAQFKVHQGKRVVSVLESDGKRYIHVDGELTPIERTKMARYLKSEGFLS
jgi:hypothetical protein